MNNVLNIMPSLSPKWFSWDASSYMHPSVGKYMVQCHASKSHSNYSSSSTTTCQNLKLSKLMQVYDTLKSELIHDPSFEFNHISRQWVEQMIDYNVRGGKMIRCLSVLDTYDVLKGEKLTDDEVFLTCALGWCVEWLQAYLLVHDDLMDGSPTRRGQPCWFRLPKVGMAAVNDGVILRNHVNRILKKHFHGKAYYVHLIDLFNEVEFQTVSGQLIDMLVVGQKDLSKYSMSLNRHIIQYKSGYYSLYLPVACVLLMLGENLDDHVHVKHILVEMGIYYQVQNDYLDTFGDPKIFGKTGSDIEEFKCSWLIAKALELANEEQKKTLSENYGKKDPTCVEKVKQLYDSLNLQGAYDDYENETYEQLIKSIEAHPNKSIQAMLKSCLEKIYKKHK